MKNFFLVISLVILFIVMFSNQKEVNNYVGNTNLKSDPPSAPKTNNESQIKNKKLSKEKVDNVVNNSQKPLLQLIEDTGPTKEEIIDKAMETDEIISNNYSKYSIEALMNSKEMQKRITILNGNEWYILEVSINDGIDYIFVLRTYKCKKNQAACFTIFGAIKDNNKHYFSISESVENLIWKDQTPFFDYNSEKTLIDDGESIARLVIPIPTTKSEKVKLGYLLRSHNNFILKESELISWHKTTQLDSQLIIMKSTGINLKEFEEAFLLKL